MNITRIFLYVSLLLVPAFGFSQEKYNSEKELKAAAEELFDDEHYAEALPLFSQLLSLYQKDPNYSYKFGTCQLFAEPEKENALKFLESASKKPGVEPEVFFYLGKAYHLNYKFENAINSYNKYKAVGNAKNIQKLKVEQHIVMAENGKKLLKNITDLVVIEKKETDEKEFFRAYNLQDFGGDVVLTKASPVRDKTHNINQYGGKLLIKPEEFQTALDKKKKERSVFYLPNGSDIIYYSSYGEDGKNGRDIFRIKKLPTGDWGVPQNVGAPINTPYDEDYPFMHPDGETFYFCSKGHNSMGGYDVFKTVLNPETGQWSTPQNLDFAINTPDDDFLFIPDENFQVAYFASKRNSVAGKTTVYKIRVDRKPLELAIIKGKVKVDPMVQATITVKSGSTLIGEYKSKEGSGDYLINLPGPGKYTFSASASGYEFNSETIEIPVQTELYPYFQDLVPKPQGATKILSFINNFTRPTDPESMEIAMQVLKDRAELEVNAKPEDLAPKDAPQANSNKPVPSSEPDAAVTSGDPGNQVNPAMNPPAKSMSNQDLVNIAKEDAQEAAQQAKEIAAKADIAINVANEKDAQSRKKAEEAEAMKATLNGLDPSQKQLKEEEIKSLEQESNALAEEAVFAYNLAMALDKESGKKEEQAQKAKTYASDLEAAVNSKSPDAINKLTAQQQQEGTAEVDAVESASADLRKRSEEKAKEAEKAEAKSMSHTKALIDIESERKQLTEQATSTKNPQVKSELELQAKELEAEYQKTQLAAESEMNKSEQHKLESY